MISSIGPFWDANETWLVLGVGILLEYAALDDRNQMIIREKISRQDIAKMVGASREMVSRVMKDFEEQGFIETLENGAILVKDRRKVPR